ncbi:MAG: hypothetical protein MUD16_06610 [Desulfobacterales bacterium]|nr:hypothetical protein [Desulfobacterales bacterium]
MWIRRLVSICVLSAVVGGCATIPPGPSVTVMPPPGKPFEAFQNDDAVCRGWAQQQSGWQANDTVNRNTAEGTVLGALMGAGLGLAIGAASGNAATGAAIGAAGGALGGAAMGSERGAAAGWEVQRRYDTAYQQCMYAKGNQVPEFSPPARRTRYLPPPPPPVYFQGGYTPLRAGPPPPPWRYP